MSTAPGPLPPNPPPRHPHTSQPGSQYAQTKFRERYATVATGGMRTQIAITALATKEVDFFVPDNPHAALATFMTCLQELNKVEDTNTGAICGYYASAITCFFPEMKPAARLNLRLIGYEPVEVKLPSQAGDAGFDVATNAYYTKCLVVMCQLCIIPFKNIAVASYTNFMDKRIAALRAHVGVPRGEEELFAIESLEKAMEINNIFGANSDFKRTLLRRIIDLGLADGVLGAAFSYVGQILAWTEMSALTFICDMLLSVDSPALYDPRVKTEIKNLVIAFKAVTSWDAPQFFKILAPARDQALIERNKFPILLAVAQTLRKEEYSAASQFVGSVMIETQVVKDLIAIHKSANQESSALSLQASLEYLTGNQDLVGE